MDLTQFNQLVLQPEALFSQVLYKRSLIGLGTIPADWNAGKMYEDARKEVIEINSDDLQLVESTLSDTEVRTFGVSYRQENVQIRPYIVSVRRSILKEGSLEKILPMAITDLNKALDGYIWKILKAKAKTGSAHSWTNPGTFITWALKEMAPIADLRKHLIIPEKIRAELLSNITSPDHRSWYSALTNRLAEVNCDIIVSKPADQAMIIIEPYLVEYSGMEPHVLEADINKEKRYAWMNLGFSSADFAARDPLAIQAYQINGLRARETADDEIRKTPEKKVREVSEQS